MSSEAGQGLKAYRRVKVESMSPGELVLATYDVAIRACRENNMKLAGDAVAELMSGLDFTYDEVAGKLVVMYDWIYRQIKEGKLEDAARFLTELREAWTTILARETEASSSLAQGADSTA
jgi:flagellin-specific chaperone FliS